MNRLLSGAILILMSVALLGYGFRSSASAMDIKEEQLKQVPGIVNEAIAKGQVPGAVILIGDKENVIYRGAFGNRAVKPEKLPMAADTIFDLASLTKVIATTTAVMQLAENGKLNLDDPVVKYWPEFGANGKEEITIGHLLIHYSGLRADLPVTPEWTGYKTALIKIIAEKPEHQPGTLYTYSDINFEVLAEIVKRVSGKPLDKYCDEHIFKPLGMKETFFKPSRSLRSRIAPTEYLEGKKKKLRWGKVHDPVAFCSGGVAGHAGLFSTADDLSIFARMILNGGSLNGVHILNPDSVAKMTMPQSPDGKMPLRGYGWNIGPPFVSNRGELQPMGSFYHTGYTGTAIWIDPVTETYIIVLTNRVHPFGKGDAGPLRKQIVALVAETSGPLAEESILEKLQSISAYYALKKSGGESNNKLQTETGSH